MLYHHDGRRYVDAATDAARNARQKFEGMFAQGQAKARQVIEKIDDEEIVDYVVPHQKLRFAGAGNDILLEADDYTGGLHPNALNQLAQKAGIGKTYVDELLEGEAWRRDLLAHNLNELFGHSEGTSLIRTVDDQVRGFLSNRFRRMDSRPILKAFVDATVRQGAVPVDAIWSETIVNFKVMLPTVFEPVPNEVLALGISFRNSDFGHGALTVRHFILRLWCTNYAITEDLLRQVHLGRRLDETIEFSEKTYRLDTETMVSAVSDVIAGAFSQDKVGAILEGIKLASEENIDSHRIKDFLNKRFSKDESKQIIDMFNSPEVVRLPPGQTKLRLSNAISWFAQDQEPVRALEVELVAGELLKPAA